MMCKMTDFEKELIHYIFHVQDKDDDYLLTEVICRKLYKHGLIDKIDGCWQPHTNYRYRWPARIVRGEKCNHGTNLKVKEIYL